MVFDCLVKGLNYTEAFKNSRHWKYVPVKATRAWNGSFPSPGNDTCDEREAGLYGPWDWIFDLVTDEENGLPWRSWANAPW